jgi:hypothetical protein
MCVVAIMSHGGMRYSKQDSTIVAADGHQLAIDWVLEHSPKRKLLALEQDLKSSFFKHAELVHQILGSRWLWFRYYYTLI